MASCEIENAASSSQKVYVPPGRSDVSPCPDCGRHFTLLALQVHKRTCLENEDCKCFVCISDSKMKFGKWRVTPRKKVSEWPFTKTNSHVNSHVQELFSSEINGVSSDSLISFNVANNSNMIQNMLHESEPVKCVDPVAEEQEVKALSDHAYVSINNESHDLSDIVTEKSFDEDKPSASPKSKLKSNDHDCNRKLFCRYCDSHVFWESFGAHIIEHCKTIQEKFIQCPECDRVFSQPALYLTHYLIHNSEHSLFCKECRCSYVPCIYTERSTQPDFAENYPHHCYICLSHFSHPQTVINHMRLHSKEMPFKCSVCSRTFRQIGNLQRHLTTHRGDRPYKCQNCSSSFADPATRRNHERVHTGETPYVCPYCSRGFTQVGNLKRHFALHLQKDPSSNTASSTLEVSSEVNTISILKPPNDIKINANSSVDAPRNNSNSKESAVTVNCVDTNDKGASGRRNGRKNGELKVFTCEICRKVYTWQHDLAVHFRTHTGEKPYKCELCDKQFAQSGAVRIHKRRHHPEGEFENVKERVVS